EIRRAAASSPFPFPRVLITLPSPALCCGSRPAMDATPCEPPCCSRRVSIPSRRSRTTLSCSPGHVALSSALRCKEQRSWRYKKMEIDRSESNWGWFEGEEQSFFSARGELQHTAATVLLISK